MKKLLITLTLLTTSAAHANFLHGLEHDIETVAKNAPKINHDIKVGIKAVKQGQKELQDQTSKIGKGQRKKAVKAQAATVGKRQTTKAITQKPKKK